MRKIFTIAFTVGMLAMAPKTLQAQVMDNAIIVQQVISPSQDSLYSENDTVDLIITVRNQGPNAMIAGDQLNLTYSLGNGSDSTSISFDTLIIVGTTDQPFGLTVGELRQYVLARDLLLNGTDVFSACADLSRGTVLFPNNTNKNSGDCAIFTVGLEANKIEIERIYFANNTIHFILNESANLFVEIYDITGKRMLRSQLANQEKQAIRFEKHAAGFYFLKVIAQDGRSTTGKFVIN